jgi:hypothetical protein
VTHGADESARRILAGIEAGDSAVTDTFPSADLSGQWADTLTGPQLVADAWHAAGVNEDQLDALRAKGEDGFSEICDTYEAAFSQAVEDEIARVARETIGPAPQYCADPSCSQQADHTGPHHRPDWMRP